MYVLAAPRRQTDNGVMDTDIERIEIALQRQGVVLQGHGVALQRLEVVVQGHGVTLQRQEAALHRQEVALQASDRRHEAAFQRVDQNITELKTDIRVLRADARTDFRLLFGVNITTTLGLAALFAKGFGWI
jgi:hypothetical protein